MKPFVAGIAAGSQTVMCGYNEADGITMCGNKEKLGWLNQLTRRMYIMTDWKVHENGPTDARGYLEAGLVQEQPNGGWEPPGRYGTMNMKNPNGASKEAKRQAAHRLLAAAEDGKQYSDNPKRV